jgi:hypothetical protein
MEVDKMAHDLVIENPQKVDAQLGEAVAILKNIKSTLETVSEIGSMDLKIGGLDTAFVRIKELNNDMDKAVKTVETIRIDINAHVKEFEKRNSEENMGY